MPESGKNLRRLQARKAAAERWNHPSKNEVAREYAAAQIEDYVTRVVEKAPPLTASQRRRITSLLRKPAVRLGGDAA